MFQVWRLFARASSAAPADIGGGPVSTAGRGQKPRRFFAHYAPLAYAALVAVGCRNSAPTAPAEASFDAQCRAVLAGDATRIVVSRETVRDADLARLAGLITLEELALDRTEITDRGLQSLSGLKGLTTLKIRGGSIGDAGIEALMGLDELRVLNLPQAQITDAGLCRLAALPRLELLRLGSPQLTDGGLKCLQDFKRLRFLHLIDVPITDAGLESMHGLTRLESFYLDGSQATDAGLERLLKALPKLHFHRDQQHLDRDPRRHSHEVEPPGETRDASPS